jgi:NAD(P)-dependent dehydrogenase (short-subunit alcohol dehydrogenase family)
LPHSLKGRVALVTGAGRGIGAAIARRLASEGCIVAAADINPVAASTVVEQIAENSGQAHVVALDITEPEGWRKAICDVDARYGALDILINNAGLVWQKALRRQNSRIGAG